MTKQQALNTLCSAQMYLRMNTKVANDQEFADREDALDILGDLDAEIGHSFDMGRASYNQANKYADKWISNAN